MAESHQCLFNTKSRLGPFQPSNGALHAGLWPHFRQTCCFGKVERQLNKQYVPCGGASSVFLVCGTGRLATFQFYQLVEGPIGATRK